MYNIKKLCNFFVEYTNTLMYIVYAGSIFSWTTQETGTALRAIFFKACGKFPVNGFLRHYCHQKSASLVP